jgi:hypothetical protein
VSNLAQTRPGWRLGCRGPAIEEFCAVRRFVILSVVPLFPGTSTLQNIEREEFEREVAARFGLVPNFFRSAPDAPYVIRELWAFAKSAYFDNPMPTLLKERLFVYLSRFCEVRYCITHTAVSC